MSALRSATASSHRRLEKRLGVTDRFGKLPHYQAHLERMWGFCAPLEQSLRVESFDSALPDYEARRKLPSLTRDLLALGVSASQISALPRCLAMPDPSSAAFAFGYAYVLEGATLGGRTLLPVVETRLGFSGVHGASYLASYGDHVGAMWRAFNIAVESWCRDADRQLSVTRAATLTFDVLSEWLCE
jgi:heme oxygenase (biliverdin-IX-beta and delta-forming)